MPRINKKTRIKGVPVKEQENFTNDKLGALPTIPRIASDNRSGKFPIVPYDDQETFVFGSKVSKGILDSLVVYYNFNSASNDFEAANAEVTVETISENEHLIRPAYSMFYSSRSINDVPLNIDDYTLTYSGSVPDDSLYPSSEFISPAPSSSFFSTKNSGFGIPFEGTEEIKDLNLTAVQFPISQSRIISGSGDAVFNLYENPGGLSDSSWSVSFWMAMMPRTLPEDVTPNIAGQFAYGFSKHLFGSRNLQGQNTPPEDGIDRAIESGPEFTDLGGPFHTMQDSFSPRGLKRDRTGIIFSVCQQNFSASIGENFADTDLFGSLVRLEISEKFGLGPGFVKGKPGASFRLFIGDTSDDDNLNPETAYLYAYSVDYTIDEFYDLGEATQRPQYSSPLRENTFFHTRLIPKWGHVAITYDGSRKGSGINIYVNGKNLNKKKEFAPQGTNRKYFYGGISKGTGGFGTTLGKNYGGISGISGTIFTINGFGNISDEVFNTWSSIDNFMTFNRVLSPNEIKILSDANLSPNPFNTKIDLFKQYIAGNVYKDGGERGQFLPSPSDRNELYTTMERDFQKEFKEENLFEFSSNVFDNVNPLKNQNQKQNLTSFKDFSNFASDGKSNEEAFFERNDDFENLNQPIWDKTKIEFELKNDFTYVLACVSQSFFNPTFTGSNNPSGEIGVFNSTEFGEPSQGTAFRVYGSNYMCYFDHRNNAWRGGTFQFPFSFTGLLSEHFNALRGVQPTNESSYTPDVLQAFYETAYPESWPKLLRMYEENLQNNNGIYLKYIQAGIPQAMHFLNNPVDGSDTFTIKDFFEHYRIGFTDTWQSGLSQSQTSSTAGIHIPDLEQKRRYIGTPTNAFGFPFADKYKNIFLPALSKSVGGFVPTEEKVSNNPGTALDISGKIASPFLLEKVVVEFSASFECPGVFWSTDETDSDGNSIMTAMPYAINTFFILNQIPGGQTPEVTQTILPENNSTYFGNKSIDLFFSSSKDELHLVTYLQHMTVATASNEDPFYFNQYTDGKEYIEILGTDNIDGKWSGTRVMSGTLKTAERLIGNSFISFLSGTNYNDDDEWAEFRLSYENGGRSGLSNAISRNFRTPFAGLQNGGSYSVLTLTSSFNERQTINNPYLILPTDKLIFGWHLPVMNNFKSYQNLKNAYIIGQGFTSPGQGPRLTLPPGVTKVTFYGSQLRNGEQFHDTLNQNLTSVTINEAIGD